MESSKSSRIQEAPVSRDPIQRAIDYGIDISLLETNLEKTVEERMQQHDSTIRDIISLRKAFQEQHP